MIHSPRHHHQATINLTSQIHNCLTSSSVFTGLPHRGGTAVRGAGDAVSFVPPPLCRGSWSLHQLPHPNVLRGGCHWVSYSCYSYIVFVGNSSTLGQFCHCATAWRHSFGCVSGTNGIKLLESFHEGHYAALFPG